MSKHILIVEDDFDFAELTAEVLKDDRFEITIIRDGKKAMDLLNKLTPDLIVMDVILPHATGIEVVTYLNSKLKKDIPILFISGSPGIAQILKNKKMHNCYFLAKPFEYQTFTDIIKYFFENKTFENFKESS